MPELRLTAQQPPPAASSCWFIGNLSRFERLEHQCPAHDGERFHEPECQGPQKWLWALAGTRDLRRRRRLRDSKESINGRQLGAAQRRRCLYLYVSLYFIATYYEGRSESPAETGGAEVISGCRVVGERPGRAVRPGGTGRLAGAGRDRRWRGENCQQCHGGGERRPGGRRGLRLARHGAVPPVRVAGKALAGVTCIPNSHHVPNRRAISRYVTSTERVPVSVCVGSWVFMACMAVKYAVHMR
jgi:hypothetical protein